MQNAVQRSGRDRLEVTVSATRRDDRVESSEPRGAVLVVELPTAE